MFRKLSIVIFILLASTMLFMYFGVLVKQSCGELTIYRTEFGLYICEGPDDEASHGFRCYAKLGGFRDYFMMRKMSFKECSEKLNNSILPFRTSK